jgi:hypothetical protein
MGCGYGSPRSPTASRRSAPRGVWTCAAGALGFLIFSHAFDGPGRYGASSFFETAHDWAPDTSFADTRCREQTTTVAKGEEAQRLSDFIENLQSYPEMAPLRRKRGGM